MILVVCELFVMFALDLRKGFLLLNVEIFDDLHAVLLKLVFSNYCFK